MTIRVEHRTQFVVVESATVNDDRLSMRARGLLVWLLEKPDDWRVSAEGITRKCTEGRDAIRSALRELERYGYLERVRSQNDSGRWTTESVVRERPLEDHEPDRDRVSSRRKGDGRAADGGESGALPSTQTQQDDPEKSVVPPAADASGSQPLKARNLAALEKLPKGVDPEDVKRLCRHLAERVGAHHPSGGLPAINPAWVKDMGTLLNSGAAGWEGHAPTVGEVVAMIDVVFVELAEPEGSKGFCWANQIRSPGALRRHWTAVEQELATRRRSARTVDRAATVAAMQAVDQALG